MTAIQQRVVLDTNTLISALLFDRGNLAWLRYAWQTNDIVPLTSHDTIEELIRVLAYPKFKLTEVERNELAHDYLPWCERVTVPASIQVTDCRDPFDRPFLALVLAAKADALITGDKDLLALANDFSVPIMKPSAFRRKLRDK